MRTAPSVDWASVERHEWVRWVPRVEVLRGGQWVDLGATGPWGDWAVELICELGAPDAPIATARIALLRQADAVSLAPTVSGSAPNRPGAAYDPLLDVGREIRVWITPVLPGEAAGARGWLAVWWGRIRAVDWHDERIEIEAVSLDADLLDALAAQDRPGGAPDPGRPIEQELQDLLTLAVPGETLRVLGSPQWGVGPYLLSAGDSIGERMRDLARQMGWDLRYRWDDATSRPRPTLYLPDRDRTSVDLELTASEVLGCDRLATALDDVRTEAVVRYRTTAGVTAEVVERDEAAIARYGVRRAVVIEGTDSPIRTQSQAQTLARWIVRDLGAPRAELRVRLPLLPRVELHDRLRLPAIAGISDYPLDVAVVGGRLRLGADGAWLEVEARMGSVVGAYYAWLARRGTGAPALPGLGLDIDVAVDDESGAVTLAWSGGPDVRAIRVATAATTWPESPAGATLYVGRAGTAQLGTLPRGQLLYVTAWPYADPGGAGAPGEPVRASARRVATPPPVASLELTSLTGDQHAYQLSVVPGTGTPPYQRRTAITPLGQPVSWSDWTSDLPATLTVTALPGAVLVLSAQVRDATGRLSAVVTAEVAPLLPGLDRGTGRIDPTVPLAGTGRTPGAIDIDAQAGRGADTDLWRLQTAGYLSRAGAQVLAVYDSAAARVLPGSAVVAQADPLTRLAPTDQWTLLPRSALDPATPGVRYLWDGTTAVDVAALRAAASGQHTHDAGQITSGVLDAARLPRVVDRWAVAGDEGLSGMLAVYGAAGAARAIYLAQAQDRAELRLRGDGLAQWAIRGAGGGVAALEVWNASNAATPGGGYVEPVFRLWPSTAAWLRYGLETPAGVRAASVVADEARSPAYASGWSGTGWRIDSAGRLEVAELTVRGRLEVYELLVRQVRATNGALAVSDAARARVVAVVDVGGGVRDVTLERVGPDPLPWASGDVLRAQRWTGAGVVVLAGVVTAATADQAVVRIGADIASPAVGAELELVRAGSTTDPQRRGLVYLTASDPGAPYVDVLDGLTSVADWGQPWAVRVRLGRLDGLAYGGQALSGYGLYADRAYLTGAIRHTTGAWVLAPDGTGHLANGRLSWTAAGDLAMRGRLTATALTVETAAGVLTLDPAAISLAGNVVLQATGLAQLRRGAGWGSAHLRLDPLGQAAPLDAYVAHDAGDIVGAWMADDTSGPITVPGASLAVDFDYAGQYRVAQLTARASATYPELVSGGRLLLRSYRVGDTLPYQEVAIPVGTGTSLQTVALTLPDTAIRVEIVREQADVYPRIEGDFVLGNMYEVTAPAGALRLTSGGEPYELRLVPDGWRLGRPSDGLAVALLRHDPATGRTGLSVRGGLAILQEDGGWSASQADQLSVRGADGTRWLVQLYVDDQGRLVARRISPGGTTTDVVLTR